VCVSCLFAVIACHSALLGIMFGILPGPQPHLVLIPFAVGFALLVNLPLVGAQPPCHRMPCSNIVLFHFLAFAGGALSLVKSYRVESQQLLFVTFLASAGWILGDRAFLLGALV